MAHGRGDCPMGEEQSSTTMNGMNCDDGAAPWETPMTTMRTYALCLDKKENVPFHIDIPASECSGKSTDELKQWIWKHCQDEIFQALRLECRQPEDSPISPQPTLRRKGSWSNAIATRNHNPWLDEKKEASLPSYKRRRLMNERTGGNHGKNDREELLDTIAHVQREFFQSASPKVVFGGLLEGLLDLMSSEYGFIGEIKYEDDGTKYLQTHAITNIAWNQATRQFYDENINFGLKFYNLNTLFGRVVTTSKPVIANSPSTDPRAGGLPEGHPRLDHFLGLPFFKNGKMMGMVGISNKPGGYAESDIEFLEPLTVTCSNLIQAFQQIKENDYLINTLEESVKARTQELETVNKNLEEANRQVRQNAVMQMQHFACMSHEIRTPLNCIIGMSSLLKETKMTPMQEESMKMIIASGDLLLAIVNDVLDYAKLETDHVEINVMRSDLQDMLHSILYSIEMKARPKGQSVKAIYDPYLPVYVNTDIRRIQQILFNLLGNAVKFSKPNDVVELSIQYELVSPPDDTVVAVSTEDPPPPSSVVALEESTRLPPVIVTESAPAKNYDTDPVSRCPFHRPKNRSGVLSPPEAPSAALGSTGHSPSPHAAAPVTDPALATKGSPPSKKKKETTTSRMRTTSRLNRPDCNMIFTVKDYGKGIDRNEFDSIFRPFQQATGSNVDPVYGGTGLGLAITKKLVTALGGIISVDSKVGAWSKFTVTLPCSDPPAPVEDLTRKMSHTTVVLVGLPSKQKENVMRVLNAFDLDVRLLEAMEQIEGLLVSTKAGGIPADRRVICLIQADRFTSDKLEWKERSKRAVTVFAFGEHSAKEKKNFEDVAHHIRSLEQVIPQALIEILDEKSIKTHIADDGSASVESDKRLADISYSHLSVLIAEDNRVNQKVLFRMLGRLRINSIDLVENGRDAVEREASKPYDVILMDQQMPIMGGVTACRAIVSRKTGSHPIPYVVFVTAHVSTDFEKECKAAGASGFLPKPFKLGDVDRCFRTVAANLIARNEGDMDQLSDTSR